MKALRRGYLLCWCACALLGGCNFPSCMYFLMPEEKEPAECKRLASDDGKKEVTVVLWTYMMNLDTREEFISADRVLSAKLTEQIRKLSEENKEKVTVVKPSLVEQYKSRHPNWQALEPEQIGHDFKADYVVNLEIDKLSLYEQNPTEMLFRGYAHILVSVTDVNNPDDTQYRKEFTDHYPSEGHGHFDAFEMEPSLFREKFLDHLAKRLSFYFVNHQKRSRMVLLDD
jgi:hypothetical protein